MELETSRCRLENVQNAKARPTVGEAGAICPDATGEFTHDALQCLYFRERWRHHVAGTVRDEGLAPTVSIELSWVGKIDTAVVY